MKALFISIFLVTSQLFQVVSAQISSFQAEYINIRLYNDSLSEFREWEGWQSSNVIILVSGEKIHIYSNFEQDYTIINEIPLLGNDYSRIIRMEAVDIHGTKCTIEILNKMNEEIYMYIRWTNLQLAYKIRKI